MSQATHVQRGIPLAIDTGFSSSLDLDGFWPDNERLQRDVSEARIEGELEDPNPDDNLAIRLEPISLEWRHSGSEKGRTPHFNEPIAKSAGKHGDSGSDVENIEELENPNPTSPRRIRQGSISLVRRPTGTSSSQRRASTASSSLPRSATRPPEAFHTFSIHVVSLLMIASALGALARLGILALATYPGESVFPLAWVQATGCAIMGFVMGHREAITQFYGPLYVALTTGFCGSLTTFSSWQLDMFQAWANAQGSPRIWIYDIMDGLTRLLFTLAISVSAFKLGLHLSRIALPYVPEFRRPSPIVRWIITGSAIALYLLTIVFFFILNHAWRPLATAALMFSFPGTLARYTLTTFINPRYAAMPLGTLLANEVATALLAAFHIIQRAPRPPSHASCAILQGLIDGFCGCLSTVSSFVAEVCLLKGRKAWDYVAMSVAVGQLFLLVMLGPSWWSGHIRENAKCRAV